MQSQFKIIVILFIYTTVFVGQNFHSITIPQPKNNQTPTKESVEKPTNVTLSLGYNITEESLKEHILILASDSLEGREVGTNGEILAADYISSFYKKIGIPPYKKDTYYQEFQLGSRKFKNVEIKINNNNYIFGKDFYAYPKFKNTTIESNEAVFLGYGIESENYNDYTTIVKNKVIVIFGGEPKDKNGNYLVSGTKKESPKSSYREKLKTAEKHGASAVLFITNNLIIDYKKAQHRIEHPGVFLLAKKDPIPYFFISKKMVENIFNGKDVIKLKKKIKNQKRSKPIQSKPKIQIKTKNNENFFYGKNVLGYIEGSDPELKNELIIITAHYDHIGIIDGKIHNGADDNASGTAAVLEIAKAFQLAKENNINFKRSILCMPVSAEEKGLLGSYYYAENPEFPLINTIANLNIDMIGRMDEFHINNDNYIYLIGSDKLSTDLHNISEDSNKKYANLELDYTFNDPNDPNRFYYRSDHYNFAKNNIPSIFYFSGVHEDYHKHTDTVEKLNYQKILKVARLIFYTAWDLSNLNERPRVDKTNVFN